MGVQIVYVILYSSFNLESLENRTAPDGEVQPVTYLRVFQMLECLQF